MSVNAYGFFIRIDWRFGANDSTDRAIRSADEMPLDPKLLPLDDYGGPTKTHALDTGSPAIDAGNRGLATDQRGFMRPVDLPSVTNVSGGDGSDMH